jgi:hypothetical protein
VLLVVELDLYSPFVVGHRAARLHHQSHMLLSPLSSSPNAFAGTSAAKAILSAVKGLARAPAGLAVTHAYGVVLLLILVSLAFQLGAADAAWARVVTIALQSVTLLAALRVSRAHRWLLRLAAVFATVAILGSVGALIGTGDLGADAARAVGLLLVAVAPVAIVIGVVRDTREAGAVTMRTMFGVLCIYLLLGMLFAYAFGLIDELSSGPFFAQTKSNSISDFLYFSFTTQTTTGFGDLTPATGLGRSLTVTEELLGQIYLVTVVAVIVGNLGRPRRTA